MGKWAAGAIVALLMAAAFFLPERLSLWRDEQLLDKPSITSRDEERGGFAESVQLTVAEKLLLMRGGGLTVMELSRELELEDAAVLNISVDENGEVSAYLTGEAALVHEEQEGSYTEELARLWEQRTAAARREVLNLQALGGLPELWTEESELFCSDQGELLYLDPDTQMSFPAYQLELSDGLCTLALSIDVQSERILSFTLQGGGSGPAWGLRGASGFGGAWRNYWGLDSVGSGWYTDHIKTILEFASIPGRNEGDYRAREQITFTYDSQPAAIPLSCRISGGRSYTITWNK